MKQWVVLCTVVVLFSCTSSKRVDQKACLDFEQRYERIVHYYKGKSSLEEDEITKMVRLTGIEVDHEFSITIDYYLTKRNIKDWKRWYRKNKHRLYWDEIDKEVKVKNRADVDHKETKKIPRDGSSPSFGRKKELFSYAYQFHQMEIEVMDINKRKGYYLIQGRSEGDTLSLLSKKTKVLVRVNTGKRKWEELKVNGKYEFDLLAIYKTRDFGGIIDPEEVDSLTKEGYSVKKGWGPKYYRILGRYGFEK